jgi:REP element-mobilizing transposase RayT
LLLLTQADEADGNLLQRLQKVPICTTNMNNRDYKQFRAGHYYHIYNRGNNKMDIFREEADYKFFLLRLKELFFPQSAKLTGRYKRSLLPAGAFTLLCYCLMPNHFHLEVRQNSDLPISALILKLCTSYSKYFNKKYDRVGSLFQDAFKAVLIDSDPYMLWLSAYIHNNPKTAELIEDLDNYPWSSYTDYVGLRQGTLCDKEIVLKILGKSNAYYKFVRSSFEQIKGRKDFQHLLLD